MASESGTTATHPNDPFEAVGSSPETPTVLVVDDEPNLRRVLSAVLERDGYRVLLADGGRDALKKAKQHAGRIDLMVTDFLMPDMNGLELLEAIRKVHPALRTLIISGHGTIRSAVEAMRLGAYDFVTKPFDVEQVRAIVRRALAAAEEARVPATTGFAASSSSVTKPASSFVRPGSDEESAVATRVGLVGDAEATRDLRGKLFAAAAAPRATVLLLGESGTGKEVAAKFLHEASARRRAPFVAVSCAALPDSLLESELFGHEKSAFTGAMAAKPGRFELADGGTLFLDEIGDIPMITQVKLLRALQEREVSRIGGVKAVKVDVRVVAATNRDLWQAVQDGTFRADLYYRLHVIPVTLPSLRERGADIDRLAGYFLDLLARENRRTFSEGIAEEALQVLRSHCWPGNIRELRNVLEYAVVMSPGDAAMITSHALPTLLTPGTREPNHLFVVPGKVA
ncbi:MAG: sigma-54-dependent Fis family transcriptional regulator [Cytophagales bacterium]|nr:sigma-54-dependent Fis family transcriptional regulator [Armatimonadota bacterium]